MHQTTSKVEVSERAAAECRLGVIGAGARLAGVVTHLRRHAPGLRVTALHDPDPDAIRRWREELAPQARACATAEELCRREDVDWVLIGSWNCHHAEQTELAFRAGKHVFCEKPLALDLDQAARMHQAWRASGKTFALGLVLRYSPLYRTAHRLLREGRIGRLLSFEFNETLTFNHGGYIHGNWRRRTRHAGSHVLEKCCHDLDLALWLTGDRPTRVASFGGRSFFTPENLPQQRRIGPSPDGCPAFQGWPDPHGVNPFTSEKDIVDHQVAILEFAGGLRATFHTNCVAALPERRFYLLGTEGSLRLDAYSGKIELRRLGWDEPLEELRPIDGDGHGGADDPMARELAECLAGRRSPAAGFAEGLHSLVVAQALDTALASGQVVDLAPLWARADDLTR